MITRGLVNPASSRNVRLILGMDRGNRRFQVFQCQIELIGIGLLGLASEGCLLEGRDPSDGPARWDFQRLGWPRSKRADGGYGSARSRYVRGWKAGAKH